MTTCQHCKQAVEKGANFCDSCGNQLAAPRLVSTTTVPLPTLHSQRDLLQASYCKKCNTEVTSAHRCPTCNGSLQTYGDFVGSARIRSGGAGGNRSNHFTFALLRPLFWIALSIYLFYSQRNSFYAILIFVRSLVSVKQTIDTFKKQGTNTSDKTN